MDNNQTIDIGRLRFEEEFDNVIFDVDVDIEKLILKVNNTTPVDHELIHHLNERRDITIKAINKIKNVNNELNVREKNHFQDGNNNQVDFKTTRKFCSYFSSGDLDGFLNMEKMSGLLLITDFYVSDKDIKKWLAHIKWKSQPQQDDTIYQVEHVFIADEIIKSLNQNEDILVLKKEQLEKIKEIIITNDGEEDRKVKFHNFDSFTNLEKLVVNDANTNLINLNSLKHLAISGYTCLNQENVHFNYPQLRTLVLSRDLGIDHLNSQVFANLPSLEELDLTSYEIKYLHNDTFINCASLRSLNLFVNGLEDISENCFYGLNNLENLSLTVKDKRLIEMDIFRHTPNLKTLKLGYFERFTEPKSQIYTIRKKLFSNLQHLKELSLKNLSPVGDSDPEIEDEDSFCMNFQALIDAFPTVDIIKISNDSFSLQFNNSDSRLYVTSFDSQNFNIKDSLDATTNIKQILNSKFKMHSQSLDIDLSKIEQMNLNECLPNKLNRLKSLKSLEVMKCDFDDSHIEIIKDLSELKDLKLFAPIMPYDSYDIIQKLSNLQELHLSTLQLGVVKKGLFDTHLNLKLLNLHFNSLEKIENGAFDKLHNLRELSLNGNKLKELDSKLFSCLKKLTKLNLNDNEIEFLDRDSFVALDQLETLSLKCNKFKSIDLVFQNGSHLKELNLDGNPEIQSIDMKQLIKLERLSVLTLPSHILDDEEYHNYCQHFVSNKKVYLNNGLSESFPRRIKFKFIS